MSDSIKSIVLRFIRGAVASAVSAMVVIAPIGITNFHQIGQWGTALIVAGVVGFISGGLLALDKAFRMQ